MKLTPFRPQTTDVFNTFLDDDYFFGLPMMRMAERQVAANAFHPALDVVEEKDMFSIKADLPGIKKEDVKVSVENGILTIEGERKSETETNGKQMHRTERSYGRFIRSLNLGTGVDYGKITGHYKDGVLELKVPKSEASKPKSIDIKVE